ncbi:MAG: B12-binding domain-containing radical SAM protein [Promethearchaeota archaeon]
MPPSGDRKRVLLLSMPDQFLGFGIAAKLPNLGLASIAGNSDADACEVGVADLLVVPDYWKGLRRLVDRFEPDLVGLSCMTFQYPTARRISRWLKEEYGGRVLVAMGGYHPTLCAAEVGGDGPNSNPWCDFVVRGEGEATFNDLVRVIGGKLDPSGVPGLSWRGPDGKFRHNPERDLVDLGALALPDRSARLVRKGFHAIGRPADVVETSRGCTNSCRFCSIRHMYGRRVRYYRVERVLADIRQCRESGARAVVFIDDNITLNPRRFEEICDAIVASGLNEDVEYHVQASVKGLTSRPSLVSKMGRANFSAVFFGVENADPRNLAFMDKRVPVRRVKALVRELHDHGMISFGGFILGNPDDDESSFEANLKFARELDLDFPAFQLLTPYPATETRDDLLAAGLVTNPDDWSRYQGLYANARTKTLDPGQLETLLLSNYFKYYTPGWFVRRLARVDLVGKYLRYILQVARRYGWLAIKSWVSNVGLLARRGEGGGPRGVLSGSLARTLATFKRLRDAKLVGNTIVYPPPTGIIGPSRASRTP